MIRYIFFMLITFSSLADSGDYYGWAGSCEDAVYDFDFSKGSYTVYGVYRYTKNGVEDFQYFINSNEITKDESGTYYMHSEIDGKIPLDLSNIAERIWGKTKTSNVLFTKCNAEEAAKLINEVKSNS